METRADAPLQSIAGYAPSGDARLYYEAAGQGPAVVLIHAAIADLRMWDPQFKLFARRFRTVRFDLRGYGKSARTGGPHSNRDDLLAVMRATGVEKAALVGCSMGGAAAIDFTLEHPEMVSALVAVGAGVGGWAEWTPQTGKFVTEMMNLVQRRELEPLRELSARHWIDGPERDPALVEPAYRARAKELHDQNFSLANFVQGETPLTPPALARLGEIEAPTLAIVGDSDEDGIAAIARRLAAAIPGARAASIANAAHLPSLEHPAEFNRLVLDFFGSLPVWG